MIKIITNNYGIIYEYCEIFSTFAEKKLYLRQLERNINNFEEFFM